jgi:glycerophosphoryl diester phosphodiesterase
MTRPPLAEAPEWIAHRGAPREFPENTLPSFERAVERGADAVELDVHATADGVVVVHHDPVLSKVASAEHRGLKIESTPWATIRTAEIGSSTLIPTLAQVLDLLAARARVYVEIKGRGIEQTVIDVIRRSRAECAIHSFDHDAVERASKIAPEIPRGILFDRYPGDVVAAMRRVSARDVWPDETLIDVDLAQRVHEAGGRVIAWTVNDAAEASRLLAMGVDGICGDDLRSFDVKQSRANRASRGW